jgi:putative transposase
MTEDPHSRNLRLHRLSDAPATFFVTKSLLPKKPLLNPARRDMIVAALAYAVTQGRIYLRAFVVVPDHWHALFGLRNTWTLPKFMHSLMSHVAAKTSRYLHANGCAWQDTYDDTRVRTARQFRYVAHYIEQNPVKKELVEKPEDWAPSSAARRDLVTDPWPWLIDNE